MQRQQVYQFSSVQSLSRVQLFAMPWTAACQASLFITNSWSLLKLMSIELVIPSNYLILCRPFSSLLQSFPASESFQMSQLFASGGQSTGISASTSVLPMKLEIMKNHSPFCNLFVVKCFWTFRKKKWGMLGVSNEGLGRFPTENVGCIILGKLDSIWYVKQNLEWFKQWAGWEDRIKWSEKF